MKIFKQIKVIIYSGGGTESALVQNEGRTRLEINVDFTVPVKMRVQIQRYLLNRINKVNKTCYQSLETQKISAVQIYTSDNFSRTNRIPSKTSAAGIPGFNSMTLMVSDLR
jgi:hypothetical protein